MFPRSWQEQQYGKLAAALTSSSKRELVPGFQQPRQHTSPLPVSLYIRRTTTLHPQQLPCHSCDRSPWAALIPRAHLLFALHAAPSSDIRYRLPTSRYHRGLRPTHHTTPCLSSWTPQSLASSVSRWIQVRIGYRTDLAQVPSSMRSRRPSGWVTHTPIPWLSR